MAVCKKNEAVKALQSFLAREKKYDIQTALEHQIAFNTNPDPKRGASNKVWGQDELKSLYDRRGQHRGASKAVHSICHNGNAFHYIIVKRIKQNAWIPCGEGTGNQLHDEVEAWNRYADTKYADFLCPCLRSYETKSDHNSPRTETALNNIVVIAQKAIEIDTLREACYSAERLNNEHGYKGETARERIKALLNFASLNNWRDVEYNGGNSGVIFDYAKNCYKAVFVDYAL